MSIIIDLLIVLGWIIIAYPFSVMLYDWYYDYFKGASKIEKTMLDGSVEHIYLYSKDMRQFKKNVKKFGKFKEE